MNEAVMNARPRFAITSRAALQASARIWFVATVVGQLIFVVYIAAFYGRAGLRGEFESWNRVLFHGYEAGNSTGNIAVGAHLLIAAAITFSGALQLVPHIRARLPVLHRWNGRLYVVAAFVMGATGLYLTSSGRKVVGDAGEHIAIDINAVLIMVCAAMALRHAMARDFRAHRRWALRLFLVVSGVWFFRVGLMFWLLVNGGPVGFDPVTFSGPFLTFLAFAQYLLPLGVLEIYFKAEGRRSAIAGFATAAGLFVLTIAMSIGIVSATMGLWKPRIKASFDDRKPIAEVLAAAIASGDIADAVRQYRELKATAPATYNFDEGELNSLGYKLIAAKKFKEAIGIFRLNTEAFPRSGNAFDSLAESYVHDGDNAQAVANYRKALQLDPRNRGAEQMILKLGSTP